MKTRQTRKRRGWSVTLILACLGSLTPNAALCDDQVPPSTKASEGDNLHVLSLEDLLKIQVRGAAGLTKTDFRRMPVTLTQIDASTIEISGARDVDRLLEIVVPNLQVMDHQTFGQHLGFRGIISDRDDKFLLQVNGRTMNHRMLLGAFSERDLPLLGDIRSVDVVRGPASATHGAGALAGLINLNTYDGLTFQGFDLKAQQGVVDLYSAVEARFGRKFSESSGLFVYYGLADQAGADPSDAPFYIGSSYAARNGLPANVAGQPFAGPVLNYQAAVFDGLRHKAFASYVNGPFELWARFVQDGSDHRPKRDIYTAAKPASLSVEDWTRPRRIQEQRSTLVGRFQQDLSEHWHVDALGSYAASTLRDHRDGTVTTAPDPRKPTEDEAFSRAVFTWSPNDAHSLAFGGEYSHNWFHDPFSSEALDRTPTVTQRDWQTDTVSFLAEYQWKLHANWTLFASARTDKHTYSDWLVSPRGVVVFTPTENDTLKLMVGRSVRRGADEELWADHVRYSSVPDPEALVSYELSYARKLSAHWSAGVNGFFEDYDALGYVPSLARSTAIGHFTIAGTELEATYRNGGTQVSLSEGFTKLMDSSVPANLPVAGQGITSEPYGYGHDLAASAPFITKLSVSHDLGKRWTASTSLVYYSGFQGAEDYAKYNASLPTPSTGAPLSDPSWTTPYGANAYWNLGLQLRPNEHWTVRLDGYNLVGMFDDQLSKRNYYLRESEFSVVPASVALSVRYRF